MGTISKIFNYNAPAPKPALWLKPDRGIILNGSTVSTWEDQSGNGHDAVQVDSTKQPTYVQNGINGRPKLRFTESWMQITNGTNLNIKYIFIVTSLINIYTDTLGPIGTNPFGAYVLYTIGTNTMHTYWGSFLTPDLLVTPTNKLFVVQFNSQEFSQPLALGVGYGGRYWDGDIVEIMIYDKDLTPQEISNCSSYLNIKYNLG